jgi:hypothetical protein
MKHVFVNRDWAQNSMISTKFYDPYHVQKSVPRPISAKEYRIFSPRNAKQNRDAKLANTPATSVPARQG